VLVDMLVHVRDYLVCKNTQKFSRREVFVKIRNGVAYSSSRRVNGAFRGSPQIITNGCNGV
jgi:hypothetical protein